MINWIPVVGFLAALAFTTFWFDKLEDERQDLTQPSRGISFWLQMIYAVTWGLLGTAVILLGAILAPNTVLDQLMVLGCGIAAFAGLDAVCAFVQRGGFGWRDLRWLVSGIVVFSTTWFTLSDAPPHASAHKETPQPLFADLHREWLR